LSIPQYNYLSNDDAVRKWLDDMVKHSEDENGVDSDRARYVRSCAKEIRRHMRMRGPDHGFSLDERGYLKLREPH